MKKLIFIFGIVLSLSCQAQNMMFFGINNTAITLKPMYLTATPLTILDGELTTVTLSVNENVTSTLLASINVINKDNTGTTIPLSWNISTGENERVGNIQTVNVGITEPYIMTIDYVGSPPDGYFFASPPIQITVNPD
jgi:hypothetical protein